jgi:hypothetical protein
MLAGSPGVLLPGDLRDRLRRGFSRVIDWLCTTSEFGLSIIGPRPLRSRRDPSPMKIGLWERQIEFLARQGFLEGPSLIIDDAEPPPRLLFAHSFTREPPTVPYCDGGSWVFPACNYTLRYRSNSTPLYSSTRDGEDGGLFSENNCFPRLPLLLCRESSVFNS